MDRSRGQRRARRAWCACAGLLGLAALCIGALLAGGAPAAPRQVKLVSHERSQQHASPTTRLSSTSTTVRSVP
jgi:hypothetical protein